MMTSGPQPGTGPLDESPSLHEELAQLHEQLARQRQPADEPAPRPSA